MRKRGSVSNRNNPVPFPDRFTEVSRNADLYQTAIIRLRFRIGLQRYPTTRNFIPAAKDTCPQIEISRPSGDSKSPEDRLIACYFTLSSFCFRVFRRRPGIFKNPVTYCRKTTDDGKIKAEDPLLRALRPPCWSHTS